MEQIVQIFKALSDETRLKILIILSRRNICAKGLARHLGISEAAVSQHLKLLKEAGIVVGVKVGYYVYYDIQKSVLSEATDFIEQLNDKSIDDNYKLYMELPDECKASCKGHKNKCCHKNK